VDEVRERRLDELEYRYPKRMLEAVQRPWERPRVATARSAD
jgi:hypothetical protein